MKRDNGEAVLSAVFVDYDNIYMSLKRKNEEAARRFAKDTQGWLKGIESSALITPTNGVLGNARRRIVMNRCYGNPVPRRNTHDNSTDMTSFPFIRHNFLRAGFEVVDCPPLTAQLKNSSDIRMVMDLRDYLTHDTYFDEFIILSGDADFTPVLHRLRQHARRTVIYANEYTAQPYTAICDGEIREADLIALLLGNTDADDADAKPALEARPAASSAQAQVTARTPQPALQSPAAIRAEIIAEIVASVRTSPMPVPLEALADRALRILGHEKTIGTGWAGAGSFRELLRQSLPVDVKLSENPPFLAYDPRRHDNMAPGQSASSGSRMSDPARGQRPSAPTPTPTPAPVVASNADTDDNYDSDLDLADEAIFETVHEASSRASSPAVRYAAAPSPQLPVLPVAKAPMARPQPQPPTQASPAPSPAPTARREQPPPQPAQSEPAQRAAPAQAASLRQSGPPPAQSASYHQPAQPAPEQPSRAQQVIQRIYEATKAPAFAPAEYRALFEIIALEINENSIAGKQTITNIVSRAADRGLDLRWENARFVYDVVSEPDPWFEQGASANLFGGRFRNYVVQRCRDAGLALSANDLDMIDAWFAATAPATAERKEAPKPPAPQPQQAPQTEAQAREVARWRTHDPLGPSAAGPGNGVELDGPELEDDFPRIVRTRR